MDMTAAAGWGLAGGLVAGLLALSSAVVAAGFKWPWHGNPDGAWPRLFVALVGIIAGGVVAAAAHTQMSGAWPALIMGAAAPSVVRGVIARVEVEEKAPAQPPPAQVETAGDAGQGQLPEGTPTAAEQGADQ